MENSIYERTQLLVGASGIARLQAARVAVFGVGGVGGYASEALARTGIGTIALIDADKVNESNLNRQMVAQISTIGKNKAEVMRAKILDINPKCNAIAYVEFFSDKNFEFINFENYDYIIDAIDSVDSKVFLIKTAIDKNIPIISVMGAGNKLFPQFEIADISKTEMCPLAKIMRTRLRAEGINHLQVVFSRQQPNKNTGEVGSIATVVGTAGLLAASAAINGILGREN